MVAFVNQHKKEGLLVTVQTTQRALKLGALLTVLSTEHQQGLKLKASSNSEQKYDASATPREGNFWQRDFQKLKENMIKETQEKLDNLDARIQTEWQTLWLADKLECMRWNKQMSNYYDGTKNWTKAREKMVKYEKFDNSHPKQKRLIQQKKYLNMLPQTAQEPYKVTLQKDQEFIQQFGRKEKLEQKLNRLREHLSSLREKYGLVGSPEEKQSEEKRAEEPVSRSEEPNRTEGEPRAKQMRASEQALYEGIRERDQRDNAQLANPTFMESVYLTYAGAKRRIFS